jgi:hypothetical protein
MQGRRLAAFWQQGMDADLWVDNWYTTFTTVRTAVLTPCIMLLVFTVLRLAGQRSLAEQTLFNKISVVALGSLVGGTALRPGQCVEHTLCGSSYSNSHDYRVQCCSERHLHAWVDPRLHA